MGGAGLPSGLIRTCMTACSMFENKQCLNKLKTEVAKSSTKIIYVSRTHNLERPDGIAPKWLKMEFKLTIWSVWAEWA